MGVAIASAKTANPIVIVLAGGLAATFAESISMGAVAYTSTIARRDHYVAEVERERRGMGELPHVERPEGGEVLEGRGFRGDELEEVGEESTSEPKMGPDPLMTHEHSLAPRSHKH